MKNFLLIALGLLLFSCGENKTETKADFSNITFSMDTVIVDPGEEIINLRGGLWSSTMNSDNSKLYLWDNQVSTLDIIDIDGLKLIEKVKFEKEGPNGVGSYVNWMSLTDDNQILLANHQGIGKFDLNSNKLSELKLEQGKFEGDVLLEGESFHNKSFALEGRDVVYGLLGNPWRSPKGTLSKVDFEAKIIKKIDLPGEDVLPEYVVNGNTENMSTIITSIKNVRKFGDRLVLSSSGYTDLYVLDLKNDSVYHVDYSPQLSAKAKKGNYPSDVDSEKRLREVIQDIYAEINFQPPIWDEQNKRYYRFSFETSPMENNNWPLFQSAEQKPLSKLFLSVLDEDFNLLGESDLSHLGSVPTFAFVKDGKIWYYVNVDDELGFVRMTFD
ncbi:hypothetical protein A33Q_4238 [Indibacter alkaliphilus LW1]|uniref:DUF4221 domain-containing protein n=1 Tax=Indibacter alkaliphilus (strain CCUG 57479 / KCTC 22604 / LW1) TaxID=1189612 RepID=S2D515_INDAL|nr:DUF4221 family protein [Indibacter alkaliphilus]EOZ92145.1 hypothetical protein A33Q_4238 [Indibacter alkaliphilus LW1]